MNADPVLVYVTFPDKNEAEAVARMLLDARLVACANITEGQSVYRWQGNIECSAECYAVFKTRADLFDEVKAVIIDAHSYDVPCVLMLPVADGFEPYLKWAQDELRQDV